MQIESFATAFSLLKHIPIKILEGKIEQNNNCSGFDSGRAVCPVTVHIFDARVMQFSSFAEDINLENFC